ncbi:MAG: hypothetical protein JWQ55_5546 [Rhodopila sp.]|nr:hypothetical protein [Rhodopila sp.]
MTEDELRDRLKNAYTSALAENRAEFDAQEADRRAEFMESIEDELYTRFEEYEEEMWVGWRRISDATEWPMIEKDLMIELT